jgi:hypothetical protein
VPIVRLLHRVEWRYMELLAEAKMLLIAAREARSGVCGELLISPESAIRHTQGENLLRACYVKARGHRRAIVVPAAQREDRMWVSGPLTLVF